MTRLSSGTLSASARLVAGAFETQMIENVPRGEYDVPVHLVVTEKRHYSSGFLER